MLKTEFQKVKCCNIIAVGGMIAAGKTTIVKILSKKLNCRVVYELDEKDEIQNVLLKGLYEKKKIPGAVFQLYFFLNRFDNYEINASKNDLCVVDRTIFEDRLFAYQNMVDDPTIFGFYESMWKNKVHELVYSVGLPKLYIILEIDWETFKERLFYRNRKVETDNYLKNEEYFKNLNRIYVDYLKKICKVYGIEYIIINSKRTQEDKLEEILKKLKELDKNVN